MTQAYLYKWTELSTGRWYVGSRSAEHCHPNDGYICSSKIVKPKIVANKNDWKREILCIGDPIYIRQLEKKYLTSINAADDPTSYNLHNGTNHRTIWNKGKKGLQKMPETHPWKNKDPWNKGVKMINTANMGGTSDKHKAAVKISNSCKEKILKTQETIANRTSEQQQQISEIYSNARKKTWSNKTPEERTLIALKAWATRRKNLEEI